MNHVKSNGDTGCSRLRIPVAAVVSVTPLGLVARDRGDNGWPQTCPRSPARTFAAGSVTAIGKQEPP